VRRSETIAVLVARADAMAARVRAERLARNATGEVDQ
jgi:hypothetical protein